MTTKNKNKRQYLLCTEDAAIVQAEAAVWGAVYAKAYEMLRDLRIKEVTSVYMTASQRAAEIADEAVGRFWRGEPYGSAIGEDETEEPDDGYR